MGHGFGSFVAVLIVIAVGIAAYRVYRRGKLF